MQREWQSRISLTLIRATAGQNSYASASRECSSLRASAKQSSGAPPLSTWIASSLAFLAMRHRERRKKLLAIRHQGIRSCPPSAENPKNGLLNKRLTLDEQAAQREAAFAAIRRLYAEALPLWRFCRRSYCRRQRTCNGDARPCLSRGWPLLPPALQVHAYNEVMRGGPRRLPPATHTEWHLRQFPPSNFVY